MYIRNFLSNYWIKYFYKIYIYNTNIPDNTTPWICIRYILTYFYVINCRAYIWENKFFSLYIHVWITKLCNALFCTWKILRMTITIDWEWGRDIFQIQCIFLWTKQCFLFSFCNFLGLEWLKDMKIRLYIMFLE